MHTNGFPIENANFNPTKISDFITVFFKGAMLMK